MPRSGSVVPAPEMDISESCAGFRTLPAMAELEITSAEGAIRKVPLADRAVTLGRADDCDVVLAETKASRKHCRVEPRDGGWRIVDEGSSNGTWLGGRPVLAARLKPGDEIEIGDTILTYAGEGPAAPREPRRPRPVRKHTPWGALFIPILCGAAAIGLSIRFGKSEAESEAASWSRYARAQTDRAALQKDPQQRDAVLEEARAFLAVRANSEAALKLLDGGSSVRGPDTPDPSASAKDDWRALLLQLDVDKSMSPLERRGKLADCLERHIAEPDAVAALREKIRGELMAAGERVRMDREQTFADADKAVTDGRYGLALSKWTRWLATLPSLTTDDDKAIAERIAQILEKSRTLANETAEQYEKLRREKGIPAAQEALEASIERLQGTGYDVWLAARGGVSIGRTPSAGKGATAKTDDALAVEFAMAKSVLAAAEEIARTHRFAEAAAKLDGITAGLKDPGLKETVAQRASDLHAEAGFLAKLLGQVSANPKSFGTIKLGTRGFAIAAASAADVSVLDANGNPEPHPVTDLPSAVFAQLTERAALETADLIPAAIFLNDLNEIDAYTRVMCRALVIDEIHLAASEVHRRFIGAAKLPDGGYMPHPKDPAKIVTHTEYQRIKYADAIAKLRLELSGYADKVEKSRQAKSVETIRKAYAKLEAARKFALELIFDEVKYFYPYRGTGREGEYAKVQHEVDERVKAVREAWAEPVKASIRSDTGLDEVLAKADKTLTEIQFYGGQAEDLVQRIDSVRMYLGHDLNVQTFYENQADLALMTYGAKVMKSNQSVKGPTEPEREQVKITNEYRQMFGHLRALRIHPFLVNSARGHSEDMAKLGFFDHFSPVEGKHSPDDRMRLAGYNASGGSENIAVAGGDPESAHNGWIHSSGHHRNILTSAWIEMGSGNSGRHWTQNFGFRSPDDWEGGEVPK